MTTADGRWYARVSLRARLTVAFLIAMTGLLCGLGAVVYVRLDHLLLQDVDLTLRSRADAVLAQFNGPVLPRLRPDLLLDADESFGEILDTTGRTLRSTRATRPAPLLTPAEVHGVRAPTFFSRPATARADPVRLLAVPGQAGGQPVVLVMGATLGDRKDALDHLLALYAVAAPVAVVLSALIGWGVAGAALRPVDRMTTSAAQISRSGQVRGRLPVPRTGDEISRLAGTMNGMLAVAEEALERERRFVDHASHELRTPLAILKAEIDLAASRPRTREELAEVLAVVGRETDRVVELAEDLLVLARTRQGGVPVHRVDVAVPELVQEVCAAFDLRARQSGTTITARTTCGSASVDPARIRQALGNMIDNALAHGSGQVTVTAEERHGRLRIEVRDAGSGFPSDLLPDVFEPFTRTLGGRGASSGAGLGLAIVKAVAEAHDGTVEASNHPQGGGRVIIDIPAGAARAAPGLVGPQLGR